MARLSNIRCMKLLLFIFLVLLTCCACDPARRINMKNIGSDTAEITWNASEDSIGFNPFVLNNSKELKYVLPPGKNNFISMTFGVGSWSPDYVDMFMKYLESVEIKSKQENIKLDSAKAIKE